MNLSVIGSSLARARGRVLAASVAEHDWSSPPPLVERWLPAVDPPALVAAARFHGVPGCLYHSLRHVQQAERAAVDALERAHYAGLAGHLRILGELPRLGAALDEAGVSWLIFKGPVLNEVVYRRPDLRAYGDIDVLVSPVHLGDALTAMEKAGCTVEDRNWDLLRRERLGEVQLTTAGGTAIDLHWHPLNDASARDSCPVDTATLLGRARAVQVGPLVVRTLSRADTLVHLAVHAAMGGGNRLVWCKDLEQVVLHDRPAWDEVVDAATEWRAGLVCAVMLRRAHRALGFDVPPHVLKRLAGQARWPAVAGLVDRLAPIERTVGHRSPARLVARSTRADDRSSAVALAGAAFAAVASGPFTRFPAEPVGDRRNPMSTYHDAGGDAGRTRFLAEVRAAVEQRPGDGRR